MWLKEVVVDGFKSYAVRASLGPFDSAFTAITGLNGTGKSNILDAICFVLGITQLQQVRVSQLSELVYKNGQAGVSAASVTLVFDNSDASRSPVGYSEYSELSVSRQVVIGGKSTYKINGQMAQQSRVATLFHSVGLNVNNPHFLIMQGRITKVINMKPTELLSLIEEAAGTRLFEAKKQTALRTIDRKQSKLDEINSLLDRQIAPSLQSLRADQQLMAQYETKQQQLSDLSRLHAAFQYHTASGHIQQLERQWAEQRQLADERQLAVARLQDGIESQQAKCDTLERQAAAARRQAESESGVADDDERPSIASLESELSEASKRLVQATSSWHNSKEAWETEREAAESKGRAVEQQKKEEKEAVERAQQLAASLSITQAQLHSLKHQLDECRAKELGVGIAAASSASEGRHSGAGGDSVQQAGGLHGALMAAQKQLSVAATRVTHAREADKQRAGRHSSETEGAGSTQAAVRQTQQTVRRQRDGSNQHQAANQSR